MSSQFVLSILGAATLSFGYGLVVTSLHRSATRKDLSMEMSFFHQKNVILFWMIFVNMPSLIMMSGFEKILGWWTLLIAIIGMLLGVLGNRWLYKDHRALRAFLRMKRKIRGRLQQSSV